MTRSHQRLDTLQLALEGAQSLAQRDGGDGTHFCDSDLGGQVAEELNTLQAALEAPEGLRHAAPKSQQQAQQARCAESEPSAPRANPVRRERTQCAESELSGAPAAILSDSP